jgi:hypothetical protein
MIIMIIRLMNGLNLIYKVMKTSVNNIIICSFLLGIMIMSFLVPYLNFISHLFKLLLIFSLIFIVICEKLNLKRLEKYDDVLNDFD